MPELPEVEAARKRLETVAKNKRIKIVHTWDDPIVFSGTTHASFATAIDGKVVKEVRRLGKNFYLVLSSPPHPIFHFGMSGMAHVRGQASPVYRVPRAKSPGTDAIWPPEKYCKLAITFEGDDGEIEEWAFCDPRRLGRIKLVDAEEAELLKVPPLGDLGADPLLAMPPVEELGVALAKRNAPIKAVLLDQNGPLCGIGNYMVDEILYQAAIHPSLPASYIGQPSQRDLLERLHVQIRAVTLAAVEVDADAERFPDNWLFKFRWGKGKKKGKEVLFVLPDGSTSTISHLTVGGRTSAIVDRIQLLPDDLAAYLATPKRSRSAVVADVKLEGSVQDVANEDESIASQSILVAAEGTPEKRQRGPVTSPHFKKAKTSASAK
ncbi:hypothetical protein JCM10908_001280 [Rhodotorula pacifica]|uniref:uncharacterized protein n=1 Tax=Rhodotorula pacifica TaxID=1495444 RepID=UPI00317B2470